MYRRPSLYAKDRDLKNWLTYDKFAYNEINSIGKLEDTLHWNAIILIAYTRYCRKKFAYNEGHLYVKFQTYFGDFEHQVYLYLELIYISVVETI